MALLKAFEKLRLPFRDIQRSGLRLLKNMVILFSFFEDLRGYAVETLSPPIRSGQTHFSDCSSDSAVAILKGMDRNEPQMRDCSLEERIFLFIAVEPGKKPSHFVFDTISHRCFVMN